MALLKDRQFVIVDQSKLVQRTGNTGRKGKETDAKSTKSEDSGSKESDKNPNAKEKHREGVERNR